MEIYWKSDKIKKEVESLAKSDKRVNKRMIQIDEAPNFLDLVPSGCGRAHFLKGNLSGYFAIDASCKNDSRRYICEPRGDNLEKDENGDYKKETITELMIIKIEKNYH